MVETPGVGVVTPGAGTAAAVVDTGAGGSSPRATPTIRKAQARIDLIVLLQKYFFFFF